MFTLDGVPLLYNGMEVGDATESADPALFDQRPIVWHLHQNDRPQFRSIYHDLIQLRQRNPAFCTSDVQWLSNSSDSALVTYVRSDGKDDFLVAVNFSNRPLDATVDLKDPAGFAAVKISGLPSTSSARLPAIHLNGFEWRIYHRGPTAVATN
jgi:glycosidase